MSRYQNAHRVFPGDSQGSSRLPLDALPEKLIVFSGIANPDRFVTALELESISYLESVAFPDHHKYSRKDIEFLNKKAEESGAMGFLTTEKDVVRIATPDSFLRPVYSLPQYLSTESGFDDYILEHLKKTIAFLNNRER